LITSACLLAIAVLFTVFIHPFERVTVFTDGEDQAVELAFMEAALCLFY
jgi:hypothetical protein